MRVRSVGAYGDGHDRDGGVSEGGVAHVVAQAEAWSKRGAGEGERAHIGKAGNTARRTGILADSAVCGSSCWLGASHRQLNLV